MPASQTTEWVALKSQPYRDKDRIVQGWSRDWGRLDVVVRGARNSTSALGAASQSLTWQRVQVQHKAQHNPSGGLSTLLQTQPIEAFVPLHQHYLLLSLGQLMGELVLKLGSQCLAHEAAPLFELLMRSLKSLNEAAQHEQEDQRTVGGLVVLLWFEVHLLGLLGLSPQWGQCQRSQAPLCPHTTIAFFVPEANGLCQQRPNLGGEHAVPLSRSTWQLLERLQGQPHPWLAWQQEAEGCDNWGVHTLAKPYRFLRYVYKVVADVEPKSYNVLEDIGLFQ